MNKILSRIAIAIASFAMVLGGVSIASNSNKQQAEPAYAEDDDFEAKLEIGDVVKMQPSSKVYPYIEYDNEEGDIVCESMSSSNPDVAYVNNFYYDDDCYYYFIEVCSGSIANASTTITLTFKDNNGEPGCSVTTMSFTVDVGCYYTPGDRVTTAPGSFEDKMVLLANNNKTKFAYVEYDYDWGRQVLRVTDDVKKASLFSMGYQVMLEYCFFQGNQYGSSEGLINIESDCAIIENSYSYEFDNYFDKSGNMVGGETYYSFYTNYPGALTCNTDQNYLGISDTDDVKLYSFDDDADVYEPLFAYSAVVELLEGESTDIKTAFSFIDGFNYEILSGDKYIEKVTPSEAYNYDMYRTVHVEASNYSGKAVIRIKETIGYYFIDITVVVKSAAKINIGNILTKSALSYSYSKNEDQFNLSDVAIRFGGMIDKDTWDTLDTKFGIDAFGVMLSETKSIETVVDGKMATAGSFENALVVGGKYDTVNDTDIKVFYDYLSSGIEPAEQGNYYFWNLYKMINATERGLTREYTAVAFILTSDGDVVFFNETTKSATLLAKEAIDTIDNINETTGGSMGYLASFYAEN